MNKLKVGIIGVGGISQTHIEGIRKSPDAVLWALCDIDPDVLGRAGGRYGISKRCCFINYADLLGCPEIDAVSICTPNESHFAIAMEAVRLHKPFALEKPVTINAGEAYLLYSSAKQAGLANMVCFSYRYKSAARYARWMLRQGMLGRIYHVYGQYLQSWAIDEDLQRIWRFDKQVAGSGALGDLGSHLLDLARFIVGDITRVCGNTGTLIQERRLPQSEEYARVDVDDYCHILAGLDGGIPAVFEISRFAYGRANYQKLEIYGSKGALVYNLEQDDYLEICMDASTGHAGSFVRVPIPEEFKSDQMQSFINIVNGEDDGLAAHLYDGYVNQNLLDCVLESNASNRWVAIEKEE